MVTYITYYRVFNLISQEVVLQMVLFSWIINKKRREKNCCLFPRLVQSASVLEAGAESGIRTHEGLSQRFYRPLPLTAWVSRR